MLFVIIAKDGQDSEAPARRARARPTHLAYNAAFEARGQILVGGPLVENAAPVGSILIASFPTRADLDTWLAADPYVLGDVWHDIEVRRFRPTAGRWPALDPVSETEV